MNVAATAKGKANMECSNLMLSRNVSIRRHGGMARDEFCGVLRCSVEEVMAINSG